MRRYLVAGAAWFLLCYQLHGGHISILRLPFLMHPNHREVQSREAETRVKILAVFLLCFGCGGLHQTKQEDHPMWLLGA